MLRPLVALLLVLVGCTDAGGGDRLTVFAASSLTEAFRALGTDAAFSFGSSARLAMQVVEGAPADVIATADEHNMRSLVRHGLVVGEPVPFATNQLVVVHRGRVRAVADLARPGLRVVLAAPSVPAGRYAEEALAAAGVVVQPASFEPDVRAVAAKVASGEADAGIVYATDAQGMETLDLGVEARYFVAAIEERGRAFVDVLLRDRGRRILRQHGFGIPS